MTQMLDKRHSNLDKGATHMTPCFAVRNERCGALRIGICKSPETCNFYKTPEQYREDRQNALERILCLDRSYRDAIANKYALKIPLDAR